ncbi:hypothetical protein TVAG_359230 [Trichomonas vaginalis G3]|uniref:GP63-like n=1 Tax=Trichomonas vaginalis (strain ATCC PRA-98 / G3) TaxID=412133 RepID=A2FZY2_TRIV3|nr:lipid binding [Trichomonas vaginalis G3]EAX89526.1 hypothetical protein TVAG_359230 [Trichomonas vaginalis G3]KAI5546933.1 lipid binding [Trichomonas vaginalis G3]|eukprot:XP_001302456.1 hypothetical protein [Trichomonas vaginalis G3]
MVSTIPVLNAYQIDTNTQDHNTQNFDSNIREMIVPFIANSTHVVGIDVYENDFIHYWTFANSETDEGVPYQCMFISMRPLEKFTLTYLIVEKQVSSYHAAAEAWHTSLNDIYDKPEAQPGAAFVADDNDLSQWAGKETLMADNYMGRILSKESFTGTKDSRFLYYKKVTIGESLPGAEAETFDYDGINVYALDAHSIITDTTNAATYTKYLLIDPVTQSQSYSKVMELFAFVKTVREKYPGKSIMITMPNIPPQIVNLIDYHLDRLDLEIPRREPIPNQYYFMNAQKTRLFGNRYALGSKKFGILDVDHRVEGEIFAQCIVLGCVPSFAVPADEYDVYDDLFVTAKYAQTYKQLFFNKSFLANGFQHQNDTPSSYYASWCDRDGSGVCYGAYLIGFKDVTECFFTPAGTTCQKLGDNTIKLSSISPYRTVVVKYKTQYMKADPTPEPEKPTQEPVVPVPENPNGAQVGANQGFRIIIDKRWVLIVVASVLVMLFLGVILALVIWLILPKKEESDQEDAQVPYVDDWPAIEDSGESVSIETGDIQAEDEFFLGTKNNPEERQEKQHQFFGMEVEPKPDDFAIDGATFE